MRKLVLIAAMLMASASAHAGKLLVQCRRPEGSACKSRAAAPRCRASTSPRPASPTSSRTRRRHLVQHRRRPPLATAPAAGSGRCTAHAAPSSGCPGRRCGCAAGCQTKVTVLPAPDRRATATPAISAPPLTAPTAARAGSGPAPPQLPPLLRLRPVRLAAPAPARSGSSAATNSPIGLWMTEKKEGKIRIEDCGGNLCGYAVEQERREGAKVLINMKPRGDKWVGRIHDTRCGGTYDSTIALRGSDKLRVQGCAWRHVLRRRDLDPHSVIARIHSSSPNLSPASAGLFFASTRGFATHHTKIAKPLI